MHPLTMLQLLLVNKCSWYCPKFALLSPCIPVTTPTAQLFIISYRDDCRRILDVSVSLPNLKSSQSHQNSNLIISSIAIHHFQNKILRYFTWHNRLIIILSMPLLQTHPLSLFISSLNMPYSFLPPSLF